ncbi:MAG: hypothetical protein WD096_08845 [Actinomycetota bacterium]
MEDMIMNIEGHRYRVPAGIADNVPWATQSVFAYSPADDATFLGFVTDEPTVEAIATKGAEQVLSLVVHLRRQDVKTLADNLTRYVEGLPPL